MNTSVLHESDFWLESLGFRQEITLTVTSVKQVEHIIEVEFWNLQVFKIFKYFTSTVSQLTNVQSTKSEAAVTVRKKSVSCFTPTCVNTVNECI